MHAAHQNGSIKSDNVKATYDGTKWSTSDVVNYSPTYQYYAYYPYSASGLAHLGASSAKGAITASETSYASGMQAVASRTSFNAQVNSGAQTPATRAVSANTSASDFFASGISNFTPATNQSTAANFNASDLQVGKATISRTLADDIEFDLTHALGLAEITLNSKTVPTTITYDGNTGNVSSQSGSSTVSASNVFSDGRLLYKTGSENLYAVILKPATDITLDAVSTGANTGWTNTFNIAANAVSAYTAPLNCTGYNIIWNYEYIGEVKSLTIPFNGTYKLEVWGAQGTGYMRGRGGLGGYSYGNISLSQDKILYVCVGRKIADGSESINGDGLLLGYAYNGGGNGSAPGGGATHIAQTTNRGELYNYIQNKDEVLIVAGGGGGAERYIGGTGGGTTGGDGVKTSLDGTNYFTVSSYRAGLGGTQTAGGEYGIMRPNEYGNADVGDFGMGGAAVGTGSGASTGGGGGGGWYGGGSIIYVGPAGGGSGHINTDYVTDGSMENGVREGSGYATITFMP